ncbi:MAG TPA: phosphatase PAP2 family protein [Candidatus Polarisedimenticolia bacterium]|jgi:undecaprenyl-diphosphatase|nr:phosphatase PAP2 family protein [Candidatus Polarisedimenticolia bacterium]
MARAGDTPPADPPAAEAATVPDTPPPVKAEPTDAAAPVDAALDPSESVDGSPADKPYWRRNLFKRIFSDQKFLFTDWIGQEVHRPGVVMPFAGGVILAASSQGSDWDNPDLELERHVFSSVDAEHSKVAIGFTELGNAGPAALFLGASYLIGRFGGHEPLAEASSLSAEALLDTGLWTTLIKRVTARTRPSAGGEGTFFQYQPPAGQSNASFPSGHASGAFALATVFSGIYGQEHRWVSWVSYGAAGMVGLSRIGLGRHFTSDVVIGSLIGNSFGRMVLARRDGAAADRRIRPVIGPTFDPETGATGAQVSLSW